jgi:nucleolar MIF4G domain-containing protein 1
MADEDVAAVSAKAQPQADAYLSRKGIYGDNDVPTQRLKRRPPTGDSTPAPDSAPATAATALSAPASAAGGSRYVPPALRRAAASGSTAEAGAAQSSTGRLARGLLNRLNESNLASIAGELEMLFMRNSRNTMTSLLTDFVIDVCVGSNRMLAHLLRVYAACVAALHTLVGMEVGASFTQTVVQHLRAEHATQLQRIATVAPGDVEAETEVAVDKRCLNMASLVALLYHFKVVHSSLICELLTFFTETLTPVDAELVLEILRTCGAKLRQDDPLALKAVLDAVRAKARASAEQSGSARMRFLLESIEDLRSNRCRILKDNRGALEPLVKALRATVRGKGGDASGPLQVSCSWGWVWGG